ncbi:hypothetical protein Tco_1540573 [Tanacetum coccineum]
MERREKNYSENGLNEKVLGYEDWRGAVADINEDGFCKFTTGYTVKMKALLEQQELAATLEELPAATIVACDNVIRKKACRALILCLGDRVLREITKETTAAEIWKSKSQSEHIDEFHKLVSDLAAIIAVILDKDQALLLLTSLPSFYDNFVETLLYSWDTLKLEDVLATLNSRKLQKLTEAKGDGGEGLYNHKKSQGFVRNEDQVSGSGADGYDNVDVMMVMSVEELLDWIMDSRSSYYIIYMRDYLVYFKEYDGGNILLGDGRECRVRGTCKVQVQIRDGSSFVLGNVRYVPELRQNLISLGTLEKEGFTVKMQSGKIKVIKGLLVLLSGTRRANCVYTLDGHGVTRKTLKGRNQIGEYHTGWKIKTGNALDFYNQRNIGFNESREYKKTFIGSGVGMGSEQVLQGVEFEVEPHEDHTFEVEPHGNVDHVAGSQEVQTQDLIYYHLALAAVDKIYSHESLTFNKIVACEVISKWKAGLKDDIDAQSDAEIWATKGLLDKAKGNVLGMEIVKDQSGNILRVSPSRFYNEKLVHTLLEGHSILSLEGSLSGDCDVEKNGKQTYRFLWILTTPWEDRSLSWVDQSQGYMTLTEATKEAIGLKRLAIESGFKLKIVAGITTSALSKAIPGPRFQRRLNLLSIGIG